MGKLGELTMGRRRGHQANCQHRAKERMPPKHLKCLEFAHTLRLAGARTHVAHPSTAIALWKHEA